MTMDNAKTSEPQTAPPVQLDHGARYRAMFLGPDKRTNRPQFSETRAVCLVRKTYKRDLPKYPGLHAQQFVVGAFGWRWWGLADDYGNFATEDAIKPGLVV